MKLVNRIYLSAVSLITKGLPVVISKPKVSLTVLCGLVLPLVALLSGIAMLLEEKEPQ